MRASFRAQRGRTGIRAIPYTDRPPSAQGSARRRASFHCATRPSTAPSPTAPASERASTGPTLTGRACTEAGCARTKPGRDRSKPGRGRTKPGRDCSKSGRDRTERSSTAGGTVAFLAPRGPAQLVSPPAAVAARPRPARAPPARSARGATSARSPLRPSHTRVACGDTRVARGAGGAVCEFT
jgi:hypothetical protein